MQATATPIPSIAAEAPSGAQLELALGLAHAVAASATPSIPQQRSRALMLGEMLGRLFDQSPADAQADGTVDPRSWQLLLRFALLNIASFILLGVAWTQGLVQLAFEADGTGLCLAIFAVFAAGLAYAGLRAFEISRDLEQIGRFDPLVPSRASAYLARIRGAQGESRGLLASTQRLALTQRISLMKQIAGSLVLLGLIGTVVGFIIALSGVDPDTAADVSAIGPMVSTLIDGMSTALYTTLVGSVLSLWLVANYQLLASGTVQLIVALIELGERHARS